MADGENVLSGVNRVLSRINQQRSDPKNEILRQRSEERQLNQFRGEAIRSIIDNSNIDPNNPSSLTGFLKDLAAIDDRFLPAFIGASNRERQIGQEQLKLQKLQTFSEELAEGGFERTGAGLAAGAPPGLLSTIFRSEITPDQPDAQGVSPGLRATFTGESINEFIASGTTNAIRDFTKLQFSPEFLESRQRQQARPPAPTTLTEDQRDTITKELKKRIENSPFFKENIEDQFLFFDAIGLNELARGESDKAKKILAEAPDDFKALINDFAVSKFGIDISQKLFERRQFKTPPSSLLPTGELTPEQKAKQTLESNGFSSSPQDIKLFLKNNPNF